MSDHPDGGTDPFLENWVPVPLESKNYDRENKAYKIVMVIPAQTTLLDNFEAMVHDELLRNAHRDGLVIEGQIMVTTADAKAAAAPEDETTKRDAQTREVLLDQSKEAEVAEAQAKMPYEMSKAEQDWRRRMRGDLRDTADEAFNFVAGSVDGQKIEDGPHAGKEWKVDRNAFMEGFFGGPVGPPRSVGMVRVTAEAVVQADLGYTADEPQQGGYAVDGPPLTEHLPNIDDMVADVDIPDDLSGLDDA